MELKAIDNGSIKFEPYDFENGISKFDLGLKVIEEKGHIYFDFEYNTDLFSEETIKKFVDDYLTILEIVVENMEIKLKDIRLKSIKIVPIKTSHSIDIEFNF